MLLQVISLSVPQHAFGLAVFNDFIFWTDWVLRAVVRVNKFSGMNVTYLMRNIERQPMAIVAIGNDTNDCV